METYDWKLNKKITYLPAAIRDYFYEKLKGGEWRHESHLDFDDPTCIRVVIKNVKFFPEGVDALIDFLKIQFQNDGDFAWSYIRDGKVHTSAYGLPFVLRLEDVKFNDLDSFVNLLTTCKAMEKYQGLEMDQVKISHEITTNLC